MEFVKKDIFMKKSWDFVSVIHLFFSISEYILHKNYLGKLHMQPKRDRATWYHVITKISQITYIFSRLK